MPNMFQTATCDCLNPECTNQLFLRKEVHLNHSDGTKENIVYLEVHENHKHNEFMMSINDKQAEKIAWWFVWQFLPGFSHLYKSYVYSRYWIYSRSHQLENWFLWDFLPRGFVYYNRIRDNISKIVIKIKSYFVK